MTRIFKQVLENRSTDVFGSIFYSLFPGLVLTSLAMLKTGKEKKKNPIWIKQKVYCILPQKKYILYAKTAIYFQFSTQS